MILLGFVFILWNHNGVNLNRTYVKLIDFDENRNNNFTLIRIFFAWLVLYGHSYAIEKSHGIVDPLNTIFKGSIWIGAIAVNGFFVISGFLVAASFVRRGLLNYLLSRFLRIYPALIVCVFFTVFILGPSLTNIDTVEYFKASKTYQYLLNALAFLRMQWYLPGVFENNATSGINGSLWTLTVEVRCYLILAVLGLFGVFRKNLISNFVIFFIYIFAMFFYNKIPLIGINEKWARLGLSLISLFEK